MEKGRPLAITRHGETLGFFVPAKTAHRPAELKALRAAANDLDAMIESWGSTEESLLKEYNEIRRTAREKNRED